VAYAEFSSFRLGTGLKEMTTKPQEAWDGIESKMVKGTGWMALAFKRGELPGGPETHREWEALFRNQGG
jgi:hypothetical protein